MIPQDDDPETGPPTETSEDMAHAGDPAEAIEQPVAEQPAAATAAPNFKAELDELIGRLRNRISDPEKQALVATITADLTALTAAHMGGDPNAFAELSHVKAQAMNLTAGEASAAAAQLEAFLFKTVQTFIAGALGAAAGA